MHSDLRQLENIIADTNELLDLAENAQWDKVVELEKLRNSAINNLFTSTPDIEAEKLTVALQFILDKNMILSTYSRSQCDSLQIELSKAGHAHKAINTYLDT
ncbi:MAG: flagellar protein FliT [Piscirickettsiaceae bacterium]|nr:MAG: flagellar protein FliT [Piscirickettsiaceae bacterium]